MMQAIFFKILIISLFVLMRYKVLWEIIMKIFVHLPNLFISLQSHW